MPGVRLNRRRFIAATAGMVSAAAARTAMAEAETLAAGPRPLSQPVSVPEPVPVLNARPDTAAVQNAQPAPAVVQETRPAGQTLPSPKGRVILSISGRISVTNTASAARFDREMLEDLGLAKFTTMTPWYNEPVTFEGVRLDRLMQVVGASGEQLRARALDDYTTEIPIADFERYQTILAMKRNGNYLPVTDKGPLFIVYPFDSHPDLKHQRFYARSAWQVARMTVI